MSEGSNASELTDNTNRGPGTAVSGFPEAEEWEKQMETTRTLNIEIPRQLDWLKAPGAIRDQVRRGLVHVQTSVAYVSDYVGAMKRPFKHQRTADLLLERDANKDDLLQKIDSCCQYLEDVSYTGTRQDGSPCPESASADVLRGTIGDDEMFARLGRIMHAADQLIVSLCRLLSSTGGNERCQFRGTDGNPLDDSCMLAVLKIEATICRVEILELACEELWCALLLAPVQSAAEGSSGNESPRPSR